MTEIVLAFWSELVPDRNTANYALFYEIFSTGPFIYYVSPFLGFLASSPLRKHVFSTKLAFFTCIVYKGRRKYNQTNYLRSKFNHDLQECIDTSALQVHLLINLIAVYYSDATTP